MSILVILGMPGNLAANSKSEQLQRKTADIKLLHQQLAERKQEATSLLNKIDAQTKELITEIRVLNKSFNFASFVEAGQHLRIHYNVELLRSLLTYIDAFEAKIRFYETGHDRLTYLRQLVQDDIKLTATLDDYEIDALATQISLVVNKYMADAHIIRIDPQPDDLMTASEVWRRIKAGQY